MINIHEIETLKQYLRECKEDSPRIARSFLEDAIPLLEKQVEQKAEINKIRPETFNIFDENEMSETISVSECRKLRKTMDILTCTPLITKKRVRSVSYSCLWNFKTYGGRLKEGASKLAMI